MNLMHYKYFIILQSFIFRIILHYFFHIKDHYSFFINYNIHIQLNKQTIAETRLQHLNRSSCSYIVFVNFPHEHKIQCYILIQFIYIGLGYM